MKSWVGVRTGVRNQRFYYGRPIIPLRKKKPDNWRDGRRFGFKLKKGGGTKRILEKKVTQVSHTTLWREGR